MSISRSNQKNAIVTLKSAGGPDWQLTLSRDCLRFVGRYRRLEGFNVDPASLFSAFDSPG